MYKLDKSRWHLSAVVTAMVIYQSVEVGNELRGEEWIAEG